MVGVEDEDIGIIVDYALADVRERPDNMNIGADRAWSIYPRLSKDDTFKKLGLGFFDYEHLGHESATLPSQRGSLSYLLHLLTLSFIHKCPIVNHSNFVALDGSIAFLVLYSSISALYLQLRLKSEPTEA
jgi:hypothetical protein